MEALYQKLGRRARASGIVLLNVAILLVLLNVADPQGSSIPR